MSGLFDPTEALWVHRGRIFQGLPSEVSINPPPLLLDIHGIL